MGMTYCISDIHGKLEALTRLLEYAGFGPDDILYVLGDWVDYGDSIGCLDYAMSTPNVITIMGNHEFMMLEVLNKILEIEKDGKNTHEDQMYYCMGNWYHNGGEVTLRQYSELSEEKRNNILDWLNKLPYSIRGLEVSDKRYDLVHAYILEAPTKLEMYKSLEEQAVWHRISVFDENPLSKEGSTSTIIFGHTATKYYGSNLRNPNGLEIVHMPKSKKIAIDCGGKALGNTSGANLGLLRLNDMKEFYIGWELGEYKIWSK